MIQSLQLHNTMTRAKDVFTPEDADNVRMYVCGPTVYDRPHLGNARSIVVYDVLYRLLTHLYGQENVTYIRNITDVDDKINTRALERGITIQALTQEVTSQFHADMAALNNLAPNKEPRATEHIADMIAMIESLIAKRFAYTARGHVLFSTTSYDNYGTLSGRNTEELIAGARIDVAAYKRHPGDFVLWKPANDGDDPSSVFDSPWGSGRPGWHIECSAMSTRYLGTNFDLHGGGADLMFPHHENEIAQSCCAHPESTFAKYWVHNGFLTVSGEKMSKSLGNFTTVHDALNQGIHGETIRFALLSTHYRKPLDWNEKLLRDAKKSLNSWYRRLQGTTFSIQHSEALPDVFRQALLDDLNLPAAFAAMHQEKDAATLYAMGSQLGLLQQDPNEWFKVRAVGTAKGSSTVKAIGDSIIDDTYIQDQIDARNAAKKAKNFADADRIRDELKAKGIVLEDKPGNKTEWRRE